jgi:hypothetical protein
MEDVMRNASVLATFAMMVIGAAIPANAFAGTWEINGSPVTESVTIKSTSTEAQFEDTKGDLGTPATVQCSLSEEGTVNKEGKGTITKFTASSCTGVRACEASGATVKALHLPWDTQLAESEKELREKISSGGSGTPGLQIECKVLGITFKDECTGETSKEVETVSKGVETTFDALSAKLTCTIGGAGSGLAIGGDVDEASSGTLSVESMAEGGGVLIRPYRWTFNGPNKVMNILIINDQNVMEEVLTGGLINGPTPKAFEVTAGQNCYNTNIVYAANGRCTVTLKSTAGSTRGQKETLQISTLKRGLQSGEYTV